MGDNSKIQWCDASWNPTIGCTRVSSGCNSCYAFQLHDQRHVAWKRGRWPDAPVQYHKPFSQVQVIAERLDQPLRWTKPRRIFVNSLSDLFHDAIPAAFIYRVWQVMRDTPRHTYQILTKRPERMMLFVREALPPKWRALPNVWLGVSVEHQAAADERIPLLVQTPAAVRFLSCEPLLGPVSIWRWTGDLHWVIVGGESGRHARPMDVGWADRLLNECDVAGVPFFFKQAGEVLGREWGCRDRHGGDASEWPDAWPREFPATP